MLLKSRLKSNCTIDVHRRKNDVELGDKSEQKREILTVLYPYLFIHTLPDIQCSFPCASRLVS